MRNIRYITVAVCATFALASCNSDKEALINEEKQVEGKVYAPQYLAKTLALALNDETLQNFIKEEAMKQKDGDYDMLLAEVIDKDVNLESLLRSSNVSGAATLRDYLLQEGLFSAKSTTGQANDDASSIVSVLKDIEENYPTLQIAVPNMENASWESIVSGDTPFYVSYLPEDYEDGDDIVAYDQNGDETVLDGEIEPTTPVIVISKSERITAVSMSSATERSAKYENAYFQNKNFAFYSLGYERNGEEKILLRSSSTYIWKANFKNQSSLRKFEPWTKGRPEVAVEITNGTENPSSIEQYEFNSKGWWKGKENILNQRIKTSGYTDNKKIYHPAVLGWWELDYEFNLAKIFGSGNKEITVPNTPDGVTVKISIPINAIGDSNDFIGYNYILPTDASGKKYETRNGKHGSGHFFFYINK